MPTVEYHRAWRAKRRAEGRRSGGGRMPLEYFQAYRSTAEGKANATAASRKYKADPANKPKIAARNKVAYALKTGALKRGDCEVCGKPEGQAHHDDYSKPLDVRWFCTKHHGQAHAKPK